MSAMVMPKRIAVEGVLAATALVFYIAANLPAESRFADQSAVDVQVQGEQTRRGYRQVEVPVNDLAFDTDAYLKKNGESIEPRRTRADSGPTLVASQQVINTHLRGRAE